MKFQLNLTGTLRKLLFRVPEISSYGILRRLRTHTL